MLFIGLFTACSLCAQPFEVEIAGEGRSMILIPGLSNGGEVWNATVEHFQSQFECHTLTLAGFAGLPSIGPPFLETVRTGLAQYIRERGLKKPVVVGHSLGGFLALWLASEEPDLVGPVISVDGVPYLPALLDPSATVESAKIQAENIQKYLASVTKEQFQIQNKMSLSMMITDPSIVDSIAVESGKSDPAAVAQATYEVMTTDLRPCVSSIRTPVLLIGSGAFAKTAEMKEHISTAYRRQIHSNHHFVLAENARHFIMLDDPQFFFNVVEEFLKAPGGTAKMDVGAEK